MRGRLLRSFLAVLLPALLLLAALQPAPAIQPDEMLADPALEQRARELGKELRCLVCQNQSLDDSDAGLARDLRRLVRERLAAGDSDAQVLEFVHDRYGDFVLLRPPVRPATWALWLAPAAVILIGGAAVLLFFRRRTSAPDTQAPLSDSERRRLSELLDRKAGEP